MGRPFRFAVQAFRGVKSATEWTALARRADELGYSTLFVADHHLGKGPATQDEELAGELRRFLAVHLGDGAGPGRVEGRP